MGELLKIIKKKKMKQILIFIALAILFQIVTSRSVRRRCTSAKTLRARALKKCRHRNKYVFYSCMVDAARGLKNLRRGYALEARILKSAKGKTCTSWGDPHVTSLFGARFNVYNRQNNR